MANEYMLGGLPPQSRSEKILMNQNPGPAQSRIEELLKNASGRTSGALIYKGTVETAMSLPSSGNEAGDVYHVNSDGSEWGWNGAAWEELGKSDLAYVTPEQFGAKGDGVTDDTVAIQTAVDSGKNVMFGYKKTYRCGTINVAKSIEIDCRWSEFICTSEKLFHCHGTVNDSIAGADYSADTLYSLPNGDKYSGMAMLKSPDIVNPTRTYFYGGFVTMLADGITCETCPVGFGNVTIDKIDPITCKIKNLGFVSHPNNPNYNYSIWCEYGLNCEFDHIKHTGEKYCVIRIFKSYGCAIKNASGFVSYSGNVTNYYPYAIADSTKTTVADSCVYSAWWSSLDTGGNYCVLDTTVKNCELHTTTGATSYGDHANTYRTVIDDCKIDSINLGALGTVRNTTITTNHGSNSQAYQCTIQLETTPIKGVNKFIIDNVFFDYGGLTVSTRGVRIHATAQTGGHTFYLDELTIHRIRTSTESAAIEDVSFAVSGDSVEAFIVDGGISLDDIQGGFIPFAESDAKITYSTRSFLSVINCQHRNSTYNGVRGTTKIGTAGLKLPERVYVRNSLLYNISGVVNRIEMTDVQITNSSENNLSASEAYCINVAGNLRVSDIVNFRYAEFVRCTIQGAYWVLANVNTSTSPPRKKYATYGADGLVWNDMAT